MKRLPFLFAGILGVLLILGIACGGAAAPTPTKAPAPKATPTPAAKPAATPTPAAKPAVTPTPPAAKPAPGATLEIGSTGDELKFDKSKLAAKAGTAVVVRFKNSAKSLEHNWVLVKAGTKDAVATDGTGAGPVTGWLKAGDNRVIANTKLLKAGETGDAQFTVPAAGTYQFVCTFPGHNAAGMFGEFTATP